MEYTKSSCKGCQERQAGCHITCERYKEYRAKLDKQTEARLQECKVNDVIKGYTRSRVTKTKRAQQKEQQFRRKKR